MDINFLNDVNTTCRLLSIGRTALYEEIREGRIKALKRGRRTLITREEILRYAESLPEMN
jgi:excisionase family DNA binding protein